MLCTHRHVHDPVASKAYAGHEVHYTNNDWDFGRGCWVWMNGGVQLFEVFWFVAQVNNSVLKVQVLLY